MKKATSKTATRKTPAEPPRRTASSEPSASSLREMPEIDFSAHRVRWNRYATRIQREGIEVSHDGPSTTSLREIPEIDFAGARMRRNPYASRAAEPTVTWQYGRGRPARGMEVGPTAVRSLRLPAPAWKRLDKEARARKTTTHALLRELVADFLDWLR